MHTSWASVREALRTRQVVTVVLPDWAGAERRLQTILQRTGNFEEFCKSILKRGFRAPPVDIVAPIILQVWLLSLHERGQRHCQPADSAA